MKPPKPINRVSARRRRVNVQRKKAQEAAWGPRPWPCGFSHYAVQLYRSTGELVDAGRCFGQVDGHEILSRAQSGRDENLIDVSGQVPLCSHHNTWVDTHHAEAERLGLWRPYQKENDQ